MHFRERDNQNVYNQYEDYDDNDDGESNKEKEFELALNQLLSE